MGRHSDPNHAFYAKASDWHDNRLITVQFLDVARPIDVYLDLLHHRRRLGAALRVKAS